MRYAPLLSAIAAALCASPTAGHGAPIVPGDPPPPLAMQLAARLAHLDPVDALELGDEGALVDELDALARHAVRPATVDSLDAAYGQILADLASSAGEAVDFREWCLRFRAQGRAVLEARIGELAPMLAAPPYEVTRYDVGDVFIDEMARRLRADVSTIVRDEYTAHHVAAPAAADIDDAYDATCESPDLAWPAATLYLRQHPASRGFTGALDVEQARRMTTALARMPRIRALLARRTPSATLLSTFPPPWRDLDIAAPLDEPAATSGEPRASERELEQALMVVHTLVEPDVLAKVTVPEVHVHADGDRSQVRWLEDQSITSAAPSIHLATDDPYDVILHQLGHTIERDLGISDWLALQRLLRARHAAATPRTADTLIALHRPPSWPGAPDEVAFRASMPAYGAFSAKVYADGATELLATSLELLGRDPRRLIERDPLLAAIVLRIVAPTELTAVLDADLLALLP